jgi:hypothetical protein
VRGSERCRPTTPLSIASFSPPPIFPITHSAMDIAMNSPPRALDFFRLRRQVATVRGELCYRRRPPSSAPPPSSHAPRGAYTSFTFPLPCSRMRETELDSPSLRLGCSVSRLCAAGGAAMGDGGGELRTGCCDGAVAVVRCHRVRRMRGATRLPRQRHRLSAIIEYDGCCQRRWAAGGCKQ